MLLALAAVLLGAASVRLIAVARAEVIARDGTVYMAMAREIATRGLAETALEYRYHPGYPALVAATARIGRLDWPDAWAHAGMGISVFLSLVTVAGIFLIGAEILPPGPALLGAALFALGGRFVEISCDAISDAMMLALCVLGLLWSLRLRRALQDRRRAEAMAMAALVGISAGLAYLVRPEGLVILFPAAGLLATAGPRAPRNWRLAAGGLILLTAAMAVAPYAIWIGSLTAKKGPSDFVHAGGLPLAAAWPGALAGAMGAVVDRGRSALGNVATVFLLITAATWLGRYVLRLQLPDKVVYLPGPGGWWVLLAPACALVPLLVGLEMNQPGDGYISSRHMLIPVAALAPLAGAGVWTCIQWTFVIHRRWRIPHWPPGVRAIWIAIALGAAMVFAFPVLHENKSPARRIGCELAEKLPRRYYWLATSGWVPFYAQAPLEQFRQTGRHSWSLGRAENLTAESLAQRARRLPGPAVCIALDDDVFAASPGLLDALGADPRFQLLTRRGQPGRYVVRIYLCRPGRG
jgi:hypothetical protein